MALVLARMTTADGSFQRFQQSWDRQLSGHPRKSAYRLRLEHAARIAGETPEDPRYGVFGIVRQSDDSRIIAYEGIAHVNHMLPGTSAAAVRVLWYLIAPRHASSRVTPQLGELFAGLISGALTISQEDMLAPLVKINLESDADRTFARTFAAFASGQDTSYSFVVKGNWLHIEPTKKRKVP